MSSGFLARWARRKALARLAEQRREAFVPAPAARAPVPDASSEPVPGPSPDIRVRDGRVPPEPGATDADKAGTADAGQETLSALPDVENLALDADFTVFMRPEVPSEIRNQALRKLWRMDPVFANLDGLNDYEDDYTDAAVVVKEGLKTAYKVGQGFLERAAQAVPEPPSETAEAVPVAARDAPTVSGAATPDPAPGDSEMAPSASAEGAPSPGARVQDA